MTPEPYPLINAEFKAHRARLHLDELKREIALYEKDRPCTVDTEEDLEREVIRHKVTIKQPHVHIFLMAGDVLQCLRTALDQAVWSAVRFNTNHTDPAWTQFPVICGPFNSKARKTFREQTEGLPEKAIEFIKSLQPYQLDPGAPLSDCYLWQINELNRIDKHRRIDVRPSVTGLHGDGPSATDLEMVEFSETDDGCELIRNYSKTIIMPKFSSVILFGDSNCGLSLTVGDMENLYSFVRYEVLPTLASTLQHKP